MGKALIKKRHTDTPLSDLIPVSHRTTCCQKGIHFEANTGPASLHTKQRHTYLSYLQPAYWTLTTAGAFGRLSSMALDAVPGFVSLEALCTPAGERLLPATW